MPYSSHSLMRAWLISFLIALAFICINGYTFNSGDQGDHLPLVYKLITPSLYPTDYFVSANANNFSIRFFYVWLIYFTQFVLPLPVTCFLFYILCLTITAWGIQQIALKLKSGILVSQAIAFSSLIVFNNFNIGGNAFIDVQLIAGTFAVTASVLALFFMLEKKWFAVAFAAGFATLFQVLAGLQIMFLVSVAFLIIEKGDRQLKIFFKMLMLYLLVSAPIMFPVIHNHLFVPDQNNSALFYHILYNIRNPNHYLPSTFPLFDYVKFALLSSIAFVVHFNVDEILKKVWRIFFITIITFMIIYYVMLEHLHIMPIGKLQWFKTSMWLTLMNVIVIFNSISKNKKITALISRIKISLPIIAIACIAAFIAITNSRSIPFEQLKYRYHIGSFPKTDLTLMHDWIKSNTPTDAIIITTPDDDSFLCEAQRSMPTGWKAIIHEPQFLIPWYHTFLLVYHTGKPFIKSDILSQAVDHYNLFPPLPTSIVKWDYRLTKGKINKTHESTIHKEGDFVLLKVNSSFIQ